MITDLCDKHRAIIGSTDGPAFRRLLRNEMVRDVKFRLALQLGETDAFEPLCCRAGDSAVTDAKLDRPGPEDPALDPEKIPKADKLIAAAKTEA